MLLLSYCTSWDFFYVGMTNLSQLGIKQACSWVWQKLISTREPTHTKNINSRECELLSNSRELGARLTPQSHNRTWDPTDLTDWPARDPRGGETKKCTASESEWSGTYLSEVFLFTSLPGNRGSCVSLGADEREWSRLAVCVGCSYP